MSTKYRGCQQESCGREESSKQSSVRKTTLRHKGWGGDGSMYLVLRPVGKPADEETLLRLDSDPLVFVTRNPDIRDSEYEPAA